MKIAKTVEGAPRKAGPYSHAVIANGTVYVAGQGPNDPATGQMVPGGITEHTRRTLDNLRIILEDSGVSLADVVKVNVYLRNLADFAEFNRVYAEYFPSAQPVRTTVGANLLGEILVEIDCIAVLP